MSRITGPAFGNDVCAALDIRADITRAITIDMSAGEVPVLRLEQFIDEGDRLIPVLRRYELVPMPATRVGRFKLRLIRRLVKA